MLTQLREMLTAGKSRQVPVEHQQQPLGPEVGKPMRSAFGVRQSEVGGGATRQFGHLSSSHEALIARFAIGAMESTLEKMASVLVRLRP